MPYIPHPLIVQATLEIILEMLPDIKQRDYTVYSNHYTWEIYPSNIDISKCIISICPPNRCSPITIVLNTQGDDVAVIPRPFDSYRFLLNWKDSNYAEALMKVIDKYK